ncbi:hypothetical protein TNCV_3885401 [Trichonephila clavipes]|nr:hypothetical protein TNCV_3885401 [Trichonephila clavipes]
MKTEYFGDDVVRLYVLLFCVTSSGALPKPNAVHFICKICPGLSMPYAKTKMYPSRFPDFTTFKHVEEQRKRLVTISQFRKSHKTSVDRCFQNNIKRLFDSMSHRTAT